MQIVARCMRRHPCPRTSLAYIIALLGLGVITLALFRKESCYEPCDTVGNTVKTVFGFWDPGASPEMTCEIPGVASRICLWEQVDPYFYLAFDVLAVIVIAYAFSGIHFLSRKRRNG